MLIDINVSLGYWPFQKFQEDAPAKLAKHLTGEGISLSLVSSIETIFYPDPDVYNKILLKKLKPFPNLMPVMVVNPSLPNWKEMLNKYRQYQKAKIIKIFPNYHNYLLSSPHIDDFMDELEKNKMSLIIQKRMIDERHQYPLLKVAGVEEEEIVKLANRFPKVPIIVFCCHLREAVSMIKKTLNIDTDISFVETMDTVKTLLKQIPAKRVLFGSHTPFLYTRSAIMKIKSADIPASDLKAIMYGNICRLLDLKNI